MYDLDSIVLYVDDVSRSKKFYAELLDCIPKELSPTFVSFELESGLKLELKVGAVSQPPSAVRGGGTEISIKVPNEASLRAVFEAWKAKGIDFAQQPTMLVFGPTFVALDPDAHRIRVFAEG
jgi:catechol 2,3-dioxygenase-like lactoylglutathione lyase family enzyme